MKNTALRAGEKKESRAITFKNRQHEQFYYEYLQKCRYQDVYHKALVYCLGIDRDTREHIDRIYDFKTGFDIYFNYVGQVNIAYSKEELAEIKLKEEQLAAEKARLERRKAKKIAENGGEIVRKKVCPHCGKEFIPTNNRQVFCSKECRYQAEQSEKKAKREAERGDQ